MVPKLLFKYKAFTKKNKRYIFDIIKNNRLYLANRKELNDPLEGIYTPIELSKCGLAICRSQDIEQSPVAEERDKYRILSLSSTAFSPQMWAYYADSYRGICFGFYNHGQFSNVQKVIYKVPNIDVITEPEDLQGIIRDDYRYKHIGWSHEKEWRIIRRSDSKFITYSPEDLACIILDKEHIDPSLYQRVRKWLPKNTPVFTIVTGGYSTRLRMLDINYERLFDGANPPFIDTDDQLFTYLSHSDKTI